METERVHTDMSLTQLNDKLRSREVLPNNEIIHRASNAPQTIFSYMVRLAQLYVECYHSDLYHDATTLAKFDWSKDRTLYYCVGENGTYLMETLTDAMMVKNQRPHVYQIIYRAHERYGKAFNLSIIKVYSPEEEG